MASILVFGSSCVDVIVKLDHLPVTEEDMHVSSQQFRVGGCAYNVANVLGKAGGEVVFVTPVGLRGLYGPFVLKELEKQNWVRPVRITAAENGCCYCLVERGGERTFLSLHGVEYTFSPTWMEPYAKTAFDFVYVSGLEVEERSGEALTDWLQGLKGPRIFYAPGPRVGTIPKERQDRILSMQPVLHLNAAEAMRLADCRHAEQAAMKLHGRTGEVVVVTLGAQGAVGVDRTGTLCTVPGEVSGEVIDTIGAGDTHAGTVLLGLSRGWDLRTTLKAANRVAARVVSVEGSTLRAEEIREAEAVVRE